MSYAYFESPIKCPECGQETNELFHLTSETTSQKVLMCDVCFHESDKDLLDLVRGDKFNE